MDVIDYMDDYFLICFLFFVNVCFSIRDFLLFLFFSKCEVDV